MENELLTKLNAATVKEIPSELKGFVTKIEQKTAREAYGDEGNWDMEQVVFVLTATNVEHNVTVNLILPYYEGDKLTENTNTGKFKHRYGKIDIGVEVSIVKNGNYREIDLS